MSRIPPRTLMRWAVAGIMGYCFGVIIQATMWRLGW